MTDLASAAEPRWDAPGNANPFVPGYYADPSIVRHEGRFYLYATLDPWGGDTLGCWESIDLKDWTYRDLNWPTKKACTSPTSAGSKVWAPSVIRTPDGKFRMFVSVGSEVWLGVADHPLGPWINALGDKPLVSQDFDRRYHMIDAEGFVDDDGSVYVYWGSGHGWVNGHCFVAKMNKDITGFDGEPKDITPGNYFEGPIMIKEEGKYYLTYSQGRTDKDTYQVHYAIGDKPFGPFVEASNSPILVTDKSRDVISPGHHTFLRDSGKTYIVYHRHSLPVNKDLIRRQLCIDELRFTDGLIAKVTPTHTGVPLVHGRATNLARGATVTASGSDDPTRGPERVVDDNYATRWAPPADSNGAWIQIDLGELCNVGTQQIVPEYAWKPFAARVEASKDGKTWQVVADLSQSKAHGSPIIINTPTQAQYLRISFAESVRGRDIGIFEWSCTGAQ